MRTLIIIFAVTVTTNLFAQTLLQRADSLLVSGESEKLLALIDNKFTDADNVVQAQLLNKKAAALTRLGRLEEAEAILMKLDRENSSASLKPIILSNLGFLYLNRGRNDLALEALKNAADLFQKNGVVSSLDAAQAMNYLGLVYKSTGKETQAEEQLQMALSIREKLLKGDHELIAGSYNDLGFAYAQRDNDKALD